MNYWLDLFTGTTWDEFRKAGANITGFSIRKQSLCDSVEAGDIFLCYLTGVMRWVGALKVIGPSDNTDPIWKDNAFPVRLEVEPLILLDAQQGIPMEELEGKVAFFMGTQDRGKFKGFLRASPTLFKTSQNGSFIFHLLQQAQKEPIFRPVDPKKLARKPQKLFKAERQKGKATIITVVSVPEPEPEEDNISTLDYPPEETKVETTRHTEIQYNLLRLGAEMGLDVWVAKNDRTRTWQGRALGTLPRMISDLPTQFNEATNRTIELIDVLWLRGNSITAAFEVECTTSIYSGLLRMSDLLALQPNLDINLYLVAPDERRHKVQQEILRPTFKLKEKPLSKVCGFIAFSTLMEKVEGIRKLGIAESLKPEFLEKTAEYFGGEE